MNTFHQKTSDWQIFPEIMVRCAGFPYSWLTKLQATETVEIIRRILVLETQLRDRQGLLLTWASKQLQIPKDHFISNKVRRVHRHVKQLRPLTISEYPKDWQEHLGDWNELAIEREKLLSRGLEVFERESQAIEQVLIDIASIDAFQEAVFLNSPLALAAIRRFLAQKERDSNRRLIWRYLQRFCAKNDTASFYGPINYASLKPKIDESLFLHPRGDGRAAQRQVRMSYWAAQAMVDAWAHDPALEHELRLYRNARLQIPQYENKLDPIDYQLLALADGRHTLKSIAEMVSESWEQMMMHIAQLVELGALHCGLLLPVYCRDPLVALDDLLKTMPISAVTTRASTQIQYWRKWLTRFEQASLTEREILLSEGEEYFTKLTNQLGHRHAGQYEVDRMIFIEEATGNLGDFHIGGLLAQRLSEQLPLVLDLLANQAIMTCQHERRHIIEQLKMNSESSISIMSLPEIIIPVNDEFERLWSALIKDTRMPMVAFTRNDLKQAGLLREDLDKWPLYCAPDIMIMAKNVEAIEQGNFTFVLAEVHHILPPTQLPFLTFHPKAYEMETAVLQKIRTLVAPAQPALTSIERENKAVNLVPLDHTLICLDWLRCEPGAVSVALADLVSGLSEHKDLQLRATGEGIPLALFPEYLEAKPSPGLLRPWAIPAMDKRAISLGPHTPRIVVENVIYQRERWDFHARDLALPPAPANSFAEFLALWRWKTLHGMPDQVFVGLSGEAKPALLDFLGISSCQAYLHDKRRAKEAAFTEILPTPDSLWLEINQELYTCELRMTLFRECHTQLSAMALI